ncbi:MAG: tRNA (adenosine(37)-N6)-threonylcarbamoyltransferase complex ATPase subunit type 1 TsaE [Planctomycetota bacterium]|nr:tRNA (adenosine(37)-N6)-threonylcarbamoyltransferase complex ATPase subunit type 1 TsaE [Planctomycetota bacterium]
MSDLPLPIAFDSHSELETQNFAGQLARTLPAGTVIALQGTLGAGKTRFVQGFAAALGIPIELVVSPTFVLHQTYQGRYKLHHFDVYRLPTADAFWDLGADEIFAAAEDYVLIEWADRILACLPERYVVVELQLRDEFTRTITVNWVSRGKGTKGSQESETPGNEA